MDQQPEPQSSHEPPAVPAAAPPTQPTGAVPGHRSSWPGVIGTLLCVFGGIGLLQRVFGVGFMALMPFLPLPPEAKITGTAYVLGLVLSVVGLPLSAVHLTAGIQTLRRKQSARKWVVIFFAYAILLAIPGGAYQYFNMQQQMQQAGQQGGMPAGLGSGFSMGMAVIGVVISLLWPTFLVIWYSRAKIREEMQGWAA